MVEASASGCGVVAGRLAGDAEAVGAGVADDLDDVLGGRGHRDSGGALVDGEVPRQACLVPAGSSGVT